MHKIEIKPLSVNEGYQGRRYKTRSLIRWQIALKWLLPAKFKLPEPPYEIYIRFGFSSKASDWDNGIKHFVDALADKYRFNDKLIRRAVIETEIVKKGQEYIEWELTHL